MAATKAPVKGGSRRTAHVGAREWEYEAKLAVLRAAIAEGDASGIAEGDVFARVRESLNFPAKGR